MNFNRKIVIGFLWLLSGVLLLLVLGVFLMPRSLAKAHVCSIPFHGSLLSDICSNNYLRLGATKEMKTMGIDVAEAIYVVSLARRTDRRSIMDLLNEALHLDWTYFDALDNSDPLVDEILYSVARQREDSTLEFKWPETLDDIRLPSLGIDAPALSHLVVRNISFDQLLCATEDNTIPTYTNTSSIPFYTKLSRGMIACWNSHVRLMASIVKRTQHIRQEEWDGREGVSAVFEDDVDMEWDLKERMERMWVDLPRDWDIVMLGHCWSNESTNASLTPSSPLHPSYNPKCTHGYVLSPLGARRLLTHLTYPPFAFSRALDQAIAHLIKTGRVRGFSVVPSIVVQRRCPADGDVNNATECHYTVGSGGDSDIWMNADGGKKGSRWRDTLQDSALERIWRANTTRSD